jgi:cell division control protein 7
MTKADISRYMYCLLSALNVVHQLQYIHRDVKPSNFLYNMNQKTGILIDFGLAQKAPSKMDCITEINRLAKLSSAKCWFYDFICYPDLDSI